VAQRSIEILIGRLITDEAFRNAFLTDGSLALQRFRDTGHDLTAVEIDAVLAMPPDLWSVVADQIDRRLQKANLSVTGKE
jgi:hypothetical protein